MSEAISPWTDPECVGFGRQPSRATCYPFNTAATALAGNRTASPWYQPLDGIWKFSRVAHPEERDGLCRRGREQHAAWAAKFGAAEASALAAKRGYADLLVPAAPGGQAR